METTQNIARDFVWEFLRTGLALSDLASSLIEMLPDGAYPDEEQGEVVIDMMTGTIQPAVEAAGPETVRDTIALMHASYDRVVGDLERVLEIVRAREAGEGE